MFVCKLTGHNTITKYYLNQLSQMLSYALYIYHLSRVHHQSKKKKNQLLYINHRQSELNSFLHLCQYIY